MTGGRIATMRLPRFGWLVETLFLILIVGLLVRIAVLYDSTGYLPQPFFYEPSDTFMDWFNTAFWSRDPGAYDSWRTIYPPLTFVVLRFLGIDSCYRANEGLPSRDCDWVGITAILAFFVINLVLCWLTFWKIDRKTAVQRTVALAMGMPMLFALERGNVLLITFTCFLLAVGPLIASARLRWLAAGIALNFKVYLIAAFLVQILKRRWRHVEGMLIATIAVYLVSYAIYGAGSPIEIFTNITNYSSGFVASQVLDIYYSVTYQPLASLLDGMVFPVLRIVGSDLAEIGLLVIVPLTYTGQALLVIALASTYFRPEAVSPHRLAALGICLALISSEAGGYTQILVILLVFMEPWKGIARPVALVCCYILCLPGEIVLGLTPTIWRDSWLSDHAVQVQIGVGLGFFLRPGLLIAVAISLSLSTIADVRRMIMQRGWRNRPHAALSSHAIATSD
jgi:hypothetical protein